MINPEAADAIIRAALKEDVGTRDITSAILLPQSKHIKAELEVKEDGVLCGIAFAERVFRMVDETLRFLPVAKDGEWVEAGREIAYIEGPGASILTAERTALNLLSHLSGIATKTRAFVDKVKGTNAKILDTRKTTPTLRVLEKYAVVTGGGVNHRQGLFDQVLIKDNHLRILREQSINDIVERVRKGTLKKTIVGIEVKNLMELAAALKAPVDYILLDNMPRKSIEEAVKMRTRMGVKIPLEVSGRVNIDNVREYAETGIERISIGALTHNAPALDISLDIVG